MLGVPYFVDDRFRVGKAARVARARSRKLAGAQSTRVGHWRQTDRQSANVPDGRRGAQTATSGFQKGPPLEYSRARNTLQYEVSR